MRTTVTRVGRWIVHRLMQGGLLVCIEFLVTWIVISPAFAFQASSSTTSWVRTIGPGGASSALSNLRSSQASAIGAASVVSGASVAMRVVASANWVTLGVAVGLTLYELYYSNSELQAIQEEAGAGSPATVPGSTTVGPGAQVFSCPGYPHCQAGGDQIMTIPFLTGQALISAGTACPSLGAAGWTFLGTQSPQTCWWSHSASVPSTAADPGVAPFVPTAEQIRDWVLNYAATHPLSLESNTSPVGVGTGTTPATQVVSQPIGPEGVTTNVVPATSVGPLDVVVNPNATPGPGPQPTPASTQTTSSTSTSTTTTIVNPDGSTTSTTTTTQTDDAPVGSCAIGNHEQRTFGGILQEHLDRWTGSGLLSALDLLKTLTWPTAVPTYSLQSTLLGTFTLDFSAWSGMLTAIRSLIIAIASFVAYRIVFVGAR